MTVADQVARPRSSRWASAVAAGFVACGLTLLVCGVGMAFWSLYGATRTQLPERNLRWDSSTPGVSAWWSILLAIVVLVVVWRAVRLRSWGTATFVSIGAGALLIGVGAVPSGLASNYAAIVAGYTASQRVPAALTAWILVTTGAVVVAVAAIVLIGDPRLNRRALTVGAVVGLVVAAATAAVVLRDADPSRYVDSTTAADAPTPPIPATLGTQRFTVRSDSPRMGDVTAVRAAGPGFVVRAKHGVRAFDSAGEERWHYLRSAETPWLVNDLRVFDGGRTVVVSFDSGAHQAGEVVGLDATTGHLLWRSDDPRMVLQFADFAGRVSRGNDDPIYLTVANGSDFARIDTRTGKRLWNIEVPHDAVAMDTVSGVGYFAGVERGDRVELRYVSLDPQTGSVRFDVIASDFRTTDANRLAVTRVYEPVHAGRNGVVFTDATGRTGFINGVTGAVSPFDGRVMFGTVDADAFVAQRERWNPYTVTDTLREQSDGRIRCTLPTDTIVVSTAWLRDEMLSVGDGPGVTLMRQSDCTAVPRTGPDVPGGTVVVAPGVVLLVNGDASEIRGYA